ncbi:hypothetical protein H072_4044 [Dactylellina haptotyla CBS 200.50]|uniref:Uncharacterized protein n=1 Tax=Dactylellina haptotyla (strain CBS 200.50) TaxID=1284197 RepID=S8ALN4_DACHA|nr:hypothetical protein H072_4044 [Dactylellina haptotyla CBS 200.50]
MALITSDIPQLVQCPFFNMHLASTAQADGYLFTYIPPDWDPSKGDWNKQAGKSHALGNRASKLSSQGVLTVRFETPFNIWCEHCNNHIAQGVRFNAEKKKIANYYSTPIFSFRVKHTVCNGWIEIHTDPKNTTYKVVEGGKRQSEADPDREGVIRIKDPEEIERLENPFAKLEQTKNDTAEKSQQAKRLDELARLSDRMWDDPYTHSQKVRRIFREEKKVRKEVEAEAEALRDKHSLAITILPETNEDIRQAKLVDFSDGQYEKAVDEAHSRPLFAGVEKIPTKMTGKDGKPMLKKEIAMQQSRARLQNDLRRSTRQKIDPFLHDTFDPTKKEQEGAEVGTWLKRKRPKPRDPSALDTEDGAELGIGQPDKIQVEPLKSSGLGLVEYGSDSDS